MAKQAYHHGNLRPALIKAALKAIAIEGPEKFTLRDVAKRAGVSAPAVYRHFESKEDLLVAVVGDAAERLGAALAEAVAHAPPDDPIERFRATGIAYVKFAVGNPEHFRALNLPGFQKRLEANVALAQEHWQHAERIRLGAAQEAGQLVMLPLDEILLSANAVVHGLAHMIVEGYFGEVSEAKAVELALVVTRSIGLGFIPRTETLVDPRDGTVATGVPPEPSAWLDPRVSKAR